MVPKKTGKLLADLRVAAIDYVKGERDQQAMDFPKGEAE